MGISTRVSNRVSKSSARAAVIVDDRQPPIKHRSTDYTDNAETRTRQQDPLYRSAYSVRSKLQVGSDFLPSVLCVICVICGFL